LAGHFCQKKADRDNCFVSRKVSAYVEINPGGHDGRNPDGFNPPSVYLLILLRTFLGRMSSREDIRVLRVPTWTLVQNRWSHSLFRHESACAQC